MIVATIGSLVRADGLVVTVILNNDSPGRQLIDVDMAAVIAAEASVESFRQHVLPPVSP